MCIRYLTRTKAVWPRRCPRPLLATALTCAFLLAAALFVSPAMAQPGASSGTIRGTMTDNSGAVIPAASVTLTGRGVTKTAQTQADGSYVFVGLAPGQYTVKAVLPGFATVNKPVNITGGGNFVLPIQMLVAGNKEEITVADENTTTLSVEPDNNATALVLRGEDLAALPDDPDDLSDALQALAGPGAGPNGGSIYIDGFSGGQLPPKESIREIRINQNPFSAEYDKLGFGRIEILTKPGTDKIRGSLGFNGQIDADEVQGSRQHYMERLLQKTGVPSNFPIPVTQLRAGLLDYYHLTADQVPASPSSGSTTSTTASSGTSAASSSFAN